MSATQEVVIGGQYWDAQLRAFDRLESGDYDVVVFRTGYGGGKTLFGADWILQTAVDVDGGHSLVLAPDRTKGGPATYKGFFKRLPGDNTVPDDADGDPENSPIVAGYHGTKHRLTLKNGHVIQLGGADIWSRFAGTEFNAIWCDEVAHYGTTSLYDLHEMLVSRQRTPEGPNVTLWTSTGNGFNEFYDITERQVTADENPLAWADRMAVVVGSALDNPFLHEKDKMVAQFEGTAREAQALHGGFAAAEGLVYDSFTRTTHVVPADHGDVEAARQRDWRIYGYDYGHADPRVLLEISKTAADQYVVLDAYYESGQPVEHLVDPRTGQGWVDRQDKPRGTVYCDHDPEHIQKFRQAGFDAQAAEKNIDEGIDEVRSVLEVDPGVGPGLLVVDDVTALVQEFLSYVEDDVGTARATDHALDALRYAVMGDHYAEPDRPHGTGTW